MRCSTYRTDLLREGLRRILIMATRAEKNDTPGSSQRNSEMNLEQIMFRVYTTMARDEYCKFNLIKIKHYVRNNVGDLATIKGTVKRVV